jgi:hypothetical protein
MRIATFTATLTVCGSLSISMAADSIKERDQLRTLFVSSIFTNKPAVQSTSRIIKWKTDLRIGLIGDGVERALPILDEFMKRSSTTAAPHVDVLFSGRINYYFLVGRQPTIFKLLEDDYKQTFMTWHGGESEYMRYLAKRRSDNEDCFSRCFGTRSVRSHAQSSLF